MDAGHGGRAPDASFEARDAFRASAAQPGTGDSNQKDVVLEDHEPLPEGWVIRQSRSTGRYYYGYADDSTMHSTINFASFSFANHVFLRGIAK
jgi:hypothetical protein